MTMKQCENGHTTYDDDKFCTECGLPMENIPDAVGRITAYLHNSYNHSEMCDEYGVSERQANVLHDLLYEVGIVIEFDENGGRIIGLADKYLDKTSEYSMWE